MEKSSSSTKWAGAGFVAAIAASLCCITPVLALLAGTTGMASSFSWLEPARPYLIGLTVVVLGFAWYQKVKPQKAAIDCDCEEDAKTPFMQTKTFLGITTVFAVIMLAFPSYAHVFYGDNSKEVIIINEADIQTINFGISGMTCTGCEEHIKHAVNELDGIVEAEASFEKEGATIKFDQSKVSIAEIQAAIDETGYTVTEQETVNE